MSYSITVHAEDQQAARDMVERIQQNAHLSEITARADGTTVTLTMQNSPLIELISGISTLAHKIGQLFRRTDDPDQLRAARS